MCTSFLGKVHVMPSKYDPETRAKAAANANLRWFAGWSNRWKEALNAFEMTLVGRLTAGRK